MIKIVSCIFIFTFIQTLYIKHKTYKNIIMQYSNKVSP